MYSTPPKKMIIINILDILNKYTDEDIDHRLSQKEIRDILARDYSMKVDRKAIKRNLMELVDSGYPIGYDETPRTTLNPKTGEYEDNPILTNFYIEHDFTNSEIRFLVDSIAFSKHIPPHQKKEIIGKLSRLTNKYYKHSHTSIEFTDGTTMYNQNLFYNLDLIEEAIQAKKVISFTYNKYGLDKKLHPIGTREASPYRIVASNGHYFLLCTEASIDDFVHYRMDRMTDILILDKQSTKHIKGLNLKEYLNSHIYMFPGSARYVDMIVSSDIIGNVIDAFGSNFDIIEKSDDALKIRIKSNMDDIFYWALQYAQHVTITEPQELRDRLRNISVSLTNKYLETDEDAFQRNIRHAKAVNRLTLGNIDLNGRVERINLPNIISAAFIYNDISDFSFVAQFKKLEKLRIRRQHIHDFSFLGEIKKLTSLSLIDVGIRDISVLEKCKKLKELEIQEEESFDMSPLYSLKNLEKLVISDELRDAVDLDRIKANNPAIKIIIHNLTKHRPHINL